jgi:hypothetical protein
LVENVSRKVVRSLTDFTRDPAAIRAVKAELGDLIERGLRRK